MEQVATQQGEVVEEGPMIISFVYSWGGAYEQFQPVGWWWMLVNYYLRNFHLQSIFSAFNWACPELQEAAKSEGASFGGQEPSL